MRFFLIAFMLTVTGVSIYAYTQISQEISENTGVVSTQPASDTPIVSVERPQAPIARETGSADSDVETIVEHHYDVAQPVETEVAQDVLIDAGDSLDGIGPVDPELVLETVEPDATDGTFEEIADMLETITGSEAEAADEMGEEAAEAPRILNGGGARFGGGGAFGGGGGALSSGGAKVLKVEVN